jgi:transposase, IS30 family
MANHYQQLTSAERATIMAMLAEGVAQSQIARDLGRSRSTISRELARNGSAADLETGARKLYDAMAAQVRRAEQLAAPRARKLEEGSVLLDVIRQKIKAGLSPEQIAGVLKVQHPDDPSRRVCHETIYTAVYVMPRGDLRTEVVACLRQARGKRRPRSRGEKRARIPDMTSINLRPPEVEDRVAPGHWEGDLIKGKANRSAVGTLVERSSRLVKIVKMPGLCSTSTLRAFTEAFASTDGAMAKTLTYDQGIEMARHRDLTAATGIKVYFADPHSPWQRGSNENTNGLIRQYLPKGMDLSKVTQDELDFIAAKLNNRPRKMHKFKSPLEVFEGLRATHT